MAREPRQLSQTLPAHLIQHAVHGADCFADATDRLIFLTQLDRAAHRHHCQVHAYVLMTNHVHLLISCPLRDGISKVMQQLTGRYAQRFNHRYGRRGALWERRFWSSVVKSDDYVLGTYRYVERNPVKAGLCENPARYRWSSAQHNAWGRQDRVVRPHAVYQQLGRTATDRQANYRKILGI
ncbi:MAG: transposase [Pseudomonadota bacterium]